MDSYGRLVASDLPEFPLEAVPQGCVRKEDRQLQRKWKCFRVFGFSLGKKAEYEGKMKRESREFGPDRLGEDLAAAGISLQPSALKQLWMFHTILRERNRELNLTRLHSYETILRKHYVDCLIVHEILRRRSIDWQGPVMDLGSGGGFPGIPLAIALPDMPWLLVEGRENRCQYLKETVEQLGLANCLVYWRKLQPADALPAGTIITRAVESMVRTAERVDAALTENGLLVFMKGPNCDGEIEAMQGMPFALRLDEHYTLPESDDRRRLVVFERISTPRRGRRLHPYGAMADRLSGALEIHSADNARYKSLKKILSGSRSIVKEGMTLVYGGRVVSEVLDHSSDQVEAIILDERTRDQMLGGSLSPLPSGGEVWVLSGELREGLGLRGFDPPYVLLRVAEIPEWEPETDRESCLLLPLGDPENLGLAIRSALAFGIRHTILLEEAALPYLPAAIRSSSGASLRMRYSRGPSIRKLADQLPGLPVIALDMKGEPLSNLKPGTGAIALLVGEEGQGLPEAFFDRKGIFLASIPMHGDVESLNAAVSVSVALYEIFGRPKENVAF